ncbi:MAG: hypothetical protein Kow00127_24180 [Bacteroidales bacterium]
MIIYWYGINSDKSGGVGFQVSEANIVRERDKNKKRVGTKSGQNEISGLNDERPDEIFITV